MDEQLLFTITGTVKKHLGRGKKLGFLTANIDIPLDISEGLYIGYTKFNGKRCPSLVFVGPALTFNELDKKAEVYILDFDEIIYNEFLEVEVVKKLRNNQKFESPEELVKQMKKDERNARAYFKELEKEY